MKTDLIIILQDAMLHFYFLVTHTTEVNQTIECEQAKVFTHVSMQQVQTNYIIIAHRNVDHI